jgi:hypothetical protein
MRKPRLYLSGPITKGSHLDNFYQGMEAHLKLIGDFAVLNPMLSMMLPGDWGVPPAEWLASDLPWVECAEAILRLPGSSEGADLETDHAKAHGIPVFHSTFHLERWREKWVKEQEDTILE